jgi:glycosyltransferase involved in cell wall biosynthesis
VHQVVPVLLPGDATTEHTFQLQRLLLEMGIQSEVLADGIHPAYAERARVRSSFPLQTQPDTAFIVQYSSKIQFESWLLERGEPFALDYHNITPPEYFRGWDGVTARDTAAARQQVLVLAERASLVICDSSFNTTELVDAGHAHTVVAPILIDFSRFEGPTDPVMTKELQDRKADGSVDWLFVGRIVPNKAQHRLIEALAMYRQTYDPRARLILAGKSTGSRYARAVAAYVDALGLRDAVTMTDSISDAALTSCFEAADVFVSLSEHEGFCIPLLEALHHRVPVVALGRAAVPETIGDAGIVLAHNRPADVAAGVHRLLTDTTLRMRMRRAEASRLEQFSLSRTRAVMRSAIESWLRSVERP